MKTRKRAVLFALIGCLFSLLTQSVWAITAIEVTKLLPSNGAFDELDLFGRSVSVSGDTAVIGAPSDGDNGSGTGSAYVFTRSGAVWVEQAKLTASDGTAHDAFGFSVSVSGDTAVIGAFGDDDNGFGSSSAYVFIRSGAVWTEEAKLNASDGTGDDIFGFSVSVFGDTAVIGAFGDNDNGRASGSAYVFTRSGVVWTEQAKLIASDSAFGDSFGFSVSVSDDTAVIGAFGDNDNGSDSGSAYVFTRSGVVWTEQVKITASDGASDDRFGGSVSVSDDTLVIGAAGDNDNGSGTGSAYVFTRQGTVWTEQAKLTASDGVGFDAFGFSVSISGDIAVIGAFADDDNGLNSGSAYIFTRSGTVWAEEAKITASDGVSRDQFGISASISGGALVIGGAAVGRFTSFAFFADSSAYVFSLSSTPLGIPIFSAWGLVGLVGLLAWLGGRKLGQ